jgi:hypothetical protein
VAEDIMHRPQISKLRNSVHSPYVVFDKNRTGCDSTGYLEKVIDKSRHIETSGKYS